MANSVYVITDVPGLSATTRPEVEPMTATPGALLVHTPPEVADDKVPVAPGQ